MSQNQETKKISAEKLLKDNLTKFKCPVCGEAMAILNHGSMICRKSHCFDMAKTGYLNLLASRGNAVYSKDLFEARRQVCSMGFYDPLTEEIHAAMKKYADSSGPDRLAVLDAGCGEGSHLSRLSRLNSGDLSCSMFGIDIAKEGIKVASRNDGIIWIVADLAKLPLKNSSFHILLNILSPANYLEFERVVRKDGIIVKIVPESSYLKELRKLVSKDNGYSNDKVIDYFTNKLELISKQNIRYQFDVDEKILPHLFKMTPLTWGSSEELNSLQAADFPSVTVDLTMIIGRKKR